MQYRPPKPVDAVVVEKIFRAVMREELSAAAGGPASKVDFATLCKLLELGERTLRRYIAARIIPYEKVPGKLLFELKDVQTALRRFRVSAVGE